jgi:hypothetical protein
MRYAWWSLVGVVMAPDYAGRQLDGSRKAAGAWCSANATVRLHWGYTGDQGQRALVEASKQLSQGVAYA